MTVKVFDLPRSTFMPPTEVGTVNTTSLPTAALFVSFLKVVTFTSFNFSRSFQIESPGTAETSTLVKLDAD